MNKNIKYLNRAFVYMLAWICYTSVHVYADNGQLQLDDSFLNEQKVTNKVGNTTEYTTIPDLFLPNRTKISKNRQEIANDRVENAKKVVFTNNKGSKENVPLLIAKETVFPKSWHMNTEPVSTISKHQPRKNRWQHITVIVLIVLLGCGVSWLGIKIGNRYANQIRKVGRHG